MRMEAVIESGASAQLEVLSGAEKGKKFEIYGQRVTIGRSENNDIVLPSESVSRNHAVIERTEDGSLLIRDNKSKNGIQVNGEQTIKAALAPGDVIQIGIFVFRFNIETAEEAGEVALAEANDVVMGEQTAMPEYTPSAKTKNRRPLIYGILGIVLAYAGYISLQEDKPKDSATNQTAKEAGAEGAAVKPPDYQPPAGDSKLLALQDPSLTRAEQETDKIDLNNSPAREAEQYFKRGQREFLNKNYHRAIDAFRTALSLDRSHELADYYYRLAVFEVESEAKRNMDLGRKYFETLQYARAIYHFNEAIQLMQHRPGDKMATDAEKYILQCKRRLQAAEQFP